MENFAGALKTIYQAPTVELAEKNLGAFAEKWDGRHPSIAKSWSYNWERIIPLFSYPVDIRKAIYTTNTIESLNMSLRKVTKKREHFPSDETCSNCCTWS
jgi:putative transposase